MAEPITTLGTILRGHEDRDAIHIAILPVIAAEGLSPGDHVKFAFGTTNSVVNAKTKDFGVGVIDPFLNEYIPKGARVWMFMYPNTITGLRHQWTHPAVDDEPKSMGDSEMWLRAFASKWNFRYDEMLSGAQEDEGYVVADGIDLHSRSELAPGDEALFWHHVEVLTGRKYDEDHREKFGWSCSC